MEYTKPVVLAYNNKSVSYAAACSFRNGGHPVACNQCDRTS